MFDAKSILDALMRGGSQPQAQGQQGGSGPLSDLLGQLARSGGLGTGGASVPGGARGRDEDTEPPEESTPRGRMPRGRDVDEDPADAPPRGGMSPRRGEEDAGPDATGGAPSLEDLLRSVLGGGQGAAGAGGGLQDILRNVLGGGQGGGMTRLQQEGAQGGGGLVDMLRQALGQATEGVKEGAGRIDDATGASGRARDAIGQMTGKSPDELIAQIKDLIAGNKLGAGAALGGLGALILGTGAGRSLAASAAKLGGLALIGGLAYKAYQNYQQGQPPLGGGAAKPQAQALLAAPEGSGFEPAAVSHEQATLLIRAMVAAAAADGRIDAAEQKKILGSLGQGGIDAAAQQFLTREINRPATVQELANGVSSQEQAVQVYTAARIAIDVDSDEEHEFLTRLADALGIDDDLAAQIDATARSAGA